MVGFLYIHKCVFFLCVHTCGGFFPTYRNVVDFSVRTHMWLVSPYFYSSLGAISGRAPDELKYTNVVGFSVRIGCGGSSGSVCTYKNVLEFFHTGFAFFIMRVRCCGVWVEL